jgi:hypothetical protein
MRRIAAHCETNIIAMVGKVSSVGDRRGPTEPAT